jgi:branched-chain amino acid aminotransferase
VIAPIGSIYDLDTKEYVEYGSEPGPVCRELYTRLRDIQYGRAEDTHGWCTIVE